MLRMNKFMKKDVIKSLESMLKSELKKEDCDSKYNNISTIMDTVETIKNSIELRNIDLTGLTLIDEMNKAEEEQKELYEAIVEYGYYPGTESKKHLLEESCDNIQVILSELKTVGIDIQEIVEYWNTEHLRKIQLRPRKDGERYGN